MKGRHVSNTFAHAAVSLVLCMVGRSAPLTAFYCPRVSSSSRSKVWASDSPPGGRLASPCSDDEHNATDESCERPFLEQRRQSAETPGQLRLTDTRMAGGGSRLNEGDGDDVDDRGGDAPSQESSYRSRLETDRKWNAILRSLRDDGKARRRRRREQVRRGKIESDAVGMTLKALGMTAVPDDENAGPRGRYEAALGVHSRLLDALETMKAEAKRRAVQYVADREAMKVIGEDVSLGGGADEDGNGFAAVDPTMIRNSERRRRELFGTLALHGEDCFNENDDSEIILTELDKEDLAMVLRVRGNVGIVEYGMERDDALELLRASCSEKLF